MKGKYFILIIGLIAAACNNVPVDNSIPADGLEQSDENFTGVKKYLDNGKLKKEVTFKNGIKEGICNNYYDDGRLKRTIWYENNIKEDTAKWYYAEGMIYRATPYKNDKIHGVQTKYYKGGRVQAEIPYKHGLRTSGLKEYYENGLEVGNIPTINQNINASKYNSEGVVTIVLTLSNKSKNVKYYIGGLIDGAFDQSKAKDVSASTGMGFVELKRSDQGGKGFIDIVAAYTTRFRNTEIIVKRIKLPYNDLK